MKPLFSVKVKVPATTANLGPGFDVLGLALDRLYNELEVNVVLRKEGGDEPVFVYASLESFKITGEGQDVFPKDDTNLIFQSATRVFEKSGKKVSVVMSSDNSIPPDRGLGSSSAAIVSGLLAANAFNKSVGKGLVQEELLNLATKIEGHPDNVAPALLGGLCVSVVDGSEVRVSVWKDPKLFRNIRAVVCVPSFELSTKNARAVLPEKIDRRDAIFNVSRTALFLSAFKEQRWDWLGTAMEDRLHQPYRKSLVPGFDDVIAAAKENGAWGACLSGAGPSILAFSPPAKANQVGRAMCAAFKKQGIASQALNSGFDLKGAQVVSRRTGKNK